MSDDAIGRQEILKSMILKLHQGEAADSVRQELTRLLGKIPYSDVVAVEQQLIAEGLPQDEIVKLCDIHTAALKGSLDSATESVPAGHPIHTFKQENNALKSLIDIMSRQIEKSAEAMAPEAMIELVVQLKVSLNDLSDIDKHYRRKENLLFPYLEKHGITGPPKVMWAKHDETRALVKQSLSVLSDCLINTRQLTNDERALLKKTGESALEMIFKEEEILFPLCLDTLLVEEWRQIARQSVEIGFCLYDPIIEWHDDGVTTLIPESTGITGRIQLPSGSFDLEELMAILNTLPVDITFVDREDTVRYFSQGRERIFDRNRAVLGRKVQLCHPPKSVHVVEQILRDFHSGAQDKASFWIELKGKFVLIEYYALRSTSGEYLGTLEVSQDLTEKRRLAGEERLLNYHKQI